MAKQFYFILMLLFAVACTSPAPLPTTMPLAVLPSPPPTPELRAETAVLPTPPPIAPATAETVRIANSVPAGWTAWETAVSTVIGQTAVWVTQQPAQLTLSLAQGAPLAERLFFPVAAFPTIQDDISLTTLRQRWQDGSLGVTTETAVWLTALWGSETAVQPLADQDALVAWLWTDSNRVGILPFDQLSPRLKLLSLAEQTPFSPTFDPVSYPLRLTVGVSGLETAVSALVSQWGPPLTNYDPQKVTRVTMSGVTALVRATASQMETFGVLYPGEEVTAVFQQADIAHLSNEVSFAADCPYPDPFGGTTFCSRESYFALLESLEVDVVELTGNHLNDWGTAAFEQTLALYQAAGMVTYGGGANLDAARQPALFTHNGNRIAFVGCNILGPTYAWATASRGGSMPCDGSLPDQISQLAADGYLVIATQQYHEYYHYAPTAIQQADFAALAQAGATAVSGSQGHHAQGFAFEGETFIHYGLGNLFFDQMDQLGTRQTFLDTYLIVDNELRSVSLWTGLIENYARPRQMTPAERQQALTAVFQASGW